MTARSVTLVNPLLGATLPFALPIGLSAFLLFSVEPLVGRLVLPVFGGTPAVWATVLFFFQEAVWARFVYLHQLLFGAIIVAVVLLMPRGILGVLQQKYNLPRTI